MKTAFAVAQGFALLLLTWSCATWAVPIRSTFEVNQLLEDETYSGVLDFESVLSGTTLSVIDAVLNFRFADNDDALTYTGDTSYRSYSYDSTVYHEYADPSEGASVAVGDQTAAQQTGHVNRVDFLSRERTGTRYHYDCSLFSCYRHETAVYTSYYDRVRGYGAPFTIGIHLSASDLAELVGTGTLDYSVTAEHSLMLSSVSSVLQLDDPAPEAISAPPAWALLVPGLMVVMVRGSGRLRRIWSRSAATGA